MYIPNEAVWPAQLTASTLSTFDYVYINTIMPLRQHSTNDRSAVRELMHNNPV